MCSDMRSSCRVRIEFRIMQEADTQRETTVYRKREMAIRQLTSCLMASYVLLSTSAAAAVGGSVREAAALPGSDPPQVRAQYPASLVAQLGSAVRITCPVYGDPRPLVSWSKDSDLVHIGWQRFRMHGAGGAWLLISDVRSTDAGRYTCKATNGFGTAVVTVDLFVVPNTNNASLYDADDVISGLSVTSSYADETTSRVDGVTSRNTTTNATAAEADGDDDVMMALLLCVGATICITSLATLTVLAVRRRLRQTARRQDKHVIVPAMAAQRLLAIATATAGSHHVGAVDCGRLHQIETATIRQQNGPSPRPPVTLYSDKWAASHVTAMKLLITRNRRDLWASSSDTCFV